MEEKAMGIAEKLAKAKNKMGFRRTFRGRSKNYCRASKDFCTN